MQVDRESLGTVQPKAFKVIVCGEARYAVLTEDRRLVTLERGKVRVNAPIPTTFSAAAAAVVDIYAQRSFVLIVMANCVGLMSLITGEFTRRFLCSEAEEIVACSFAGDNNLALLLNGKQGKQTLKVLRVDSAGLAVVSSAELEEQASALALCESTVLLVTADGVSKGDCSAIEYEFSSRRLRLAAPCASRPERGFRPRLAAPLAPQTPR